MYENNVNHSDYSSKDMYTVFLHDTVKKLSPYECRSNIDEDHKYWRILIVLSFVGGQVYLFHMIGKWGDFVDKYYRP